ncbi:hypothetical protein SAMN02745117_01893 [Lampropedia hyalina DSM 16112]|jgi:hypothetical protein|uniref:Uncharacterized protein n=2 Tax=Lampropedia TaxID=198705 RepID=A0A1M5BEL0_9BURK|nr:hypothetical protein SAMN02745117_01893 [Lampropedia hyalina DSM 16112]
MLIQRTPHAAKALSDRAACSLRERQLLIMCNGTRSSMDIVTLLGHEVLPLLLQMEGKGLLTGVSQPIKEAIGIKTIPVEPPPKPVLPPRSKSPSLASAKVYVMDLMQLQQNESAEKIARALQVASEPNEMMKLMLWALATILQRSGESYAERAVQRVFEVIPAAHLQEFMNYAQEFNIPLFDRITQLYRAHLPTPSA